MSKKFIPIYDLSNLNEQQKQDYVTAVCDHLEVPQELNLVRLIWSDEGDGARRQVAYVLKGATDIIREKRKITTESLTSQVIQGSVVFTATGQDVSKRQEIAVGSAFIDGIKGKGLDNAIMTAQTRATRRMTLQFVGGGVLDESEIATSTTNIASQSAPLSQLSLAPTPTVAPSSEPGKDITLIGPSKDEKTQAQVAAVIAIRDQSLVPTSETQEEFEARQAKLRADAIAQLNETAKRREAGIEPTHNEPAIEIAKVSEPIPEDSLIAAKKPRKPRGPNKPKVDLGPSEMPKPDIKPDTSVAVVAPTPVPAVVSEPVKPDIKPDTAPVLPAKPRLTPDQVKPFRQRLFRVVNDYLEPHGFSPKEGMGNADKMRAFANVMFPEVTNMNELNVEQWEKYLSNLENKIKVEGPDQTVKYIEESIGI